MNYAHAKLIEISPQNLVGKKIKRINDESCNVLLIEFSDSTNVAFECHTDFQGTNYYTIMEETNMKNPAWKQNTPVDQLKAIRWSISGHLSNFRDNVISKEKFIQYLKEYLSQVENLEPFLDGQQEW